MIVVFLRIFGTKMNKYRYYIPLRTETPPGPPGPSTMAQSLEAHEGLCGSKHENGPHLGLGVRWGPGVHTRGWRVPGASIWSPRPTLRLSTGFEIFWKNRFSDPKMAQSLEAHEGLGGPKT